MISSCPLPHSPETDERQWISAGARSVAKLRNIAKSRPTQRTSLNIQLTANEARVIGCLMEKSVITPDLYPLSLNALVNACNQKSSRDPVLSLEQNVVQRTVNDLIAKRHVMVQTFRSEERRVGKERKTR